MSERKDGGSAFPFEQITKREAGAPSEWINHRGMSLRDYFAAKAMQGLLSKHGGFVDDLTRPGTTQDFSEDAPDIDEVAGYAYAMADAMLAARERS